MKLIPFFAKIYASFYYYYACRWQKRPAQFQIKILKTFISLAKDTCFGKDHDFRNIKTHKDFIEKVPIREYEAISPYIDKVQQGDKDVLWPGIPLYLSKTSGTTSGIKYIPITREAMHYQIKAAREMLLFYIHASKKASFLLGKLIFFSGSPKLDHSKKISSGRLSGIVNHHIPKYLRKSQLPSYSTNCIEDWESKIDHIVKETIHEDLRLISGIPPWVQMYLDRTEQTTGKRIQEVFPNLSLYVHGGVNFEPYRTQMEKSLGGKIDTIETYPASEGFFAFQDRLHEKGLLLLVNAGIFYEFIPVQDLGKETISRLMIDQIILGENYAMVISTNAGLWAYLIGDTVKFISKNPYRILVTGRVKQFISAFGEHVIVEEVETALREISDQHEANIVEFTVAPEVNPSFGILPHHEWFIEFGQEPEDLVAFASDLDKTMQGKNHYYKDLIKGNILQPLIIRSMKAKSFQHYMKNMGKLGGQNKVPHLSNERNIADELKGWIIQDQAYI